MENLSHSRQPNKSSTSVSKKSCNGTHFMTKTSYDDLFGGPPKFKAPTLAPGAGDYSEIFGGFHAPEATSIPVLHLPVVEEEDVFFDVQSSGVDYNEVFGCFDGLNFAVSFEELMMDQSNGLNGDVGSCEDAWTPAESDSLSEESDKSAKNQSLSNRDSYESESIDGSIEFKISFHKANQRSDEDMPNGITCVSQTHAIPGYTFLVDKTTPSEKAYYGNPPLEVTDDSNLHMDFGGRMMREKNLKKAVSQPSAGSSGKEAFANGLKSQRAYGRNSSLPNKSFITVSEISLRTQPSEVPPPCRSAPLLDFNKGDLGKIVSEGIMGYTSPPVYDVEVDASSSAAVSAAAMKEVMEKAQAKLKTAKELLERKRECVQSRKYNREEKEGKMFGTVEGSSSIREERLYGTRERQANGMVFSVRDERQRDSTKTNADPDSLEGENVFNVGKTLAEKHGRSGKIVEAGEWKESTEFSELVQTERSTFEQANYDEVLELDAKIQDCRQKIKKGATEAMDHKRINGRTIETNRVVFELGENEKKLKFAKEACEESESNRRSGAAIATHRHKGHEKRVKVAREFCDQVEEEKYRVVQLSVENEKKPSGADVPEKHENMVKLQHKESRFEVKRAVKHRENEQLLRETNRSMGNETTFKESCDMSANGRRQREAVEEIKNEKKVEDLEQEHKERLLMGIVDLEENVKKFEEAREREESERRLKETLGKKENEKKQIEAFEWEVSEKQLKRGFEQEENEKQQREAREREENEKRLKKALKKEEQERKQKETSKREKTERRLQEIRDMEKMDKGLKEADEKEEAEKGLGVVCEQVDNCKTLKEAQRRIGESEIRSKEAFGKEESRNMSKDDETEGLKELNRSREQNRWSEYGKKLKIAEGPGVFKEEEDLMVSGKARLLDDNENFRVTQLAGQHGENSKKEDVSQGAFSYEGNVEIQIEYGDVEMEAAAVETTNALADRKSEVFGMAQYNLKHEEYTLKMKDVAEPLYEDLNVKTTGESGMGMGQEKASSCLQPASGTENQTQLVKESAQNGRKMESAQQSVLEGKRNIQKTSQSANASQNPERKDKNINETLASEDTEAERMKRERELEIEALRRIEEERDRERERERERAHDEARERAHVKARERAERAVVERATSEAPQRALAEARERLEKACAEAMEKSLAEKALHASSGSSAMKPSSSSSDLQDQKFYIASSFNSSRYPYSSASYNAERADGVEDESAQRSKARLERHQRTAERAAKALAEKNMRDLLAQREQAERNRLAETLDADVKRWSRGKEGNLRALLSTLQYILGPDSAWHPIPLTEVITSAAVKKAYRKATLCVHPDKLQQRGASIQQKYICEKVFDLLKEAWNKFNSEER